MPDRERKRVPDHRPDDDDNGNNGVDREAVNGYDAALLQHNAVSLRTKLLHDFHTHNNTAKVTQGTKKVKKVAHYYIGFPQNKTRKDYWTKSTIKKRDPTKLPEEREREGERRKKKLLCPREWKELWPTLANICVWDRALFARKIFALVSSL